MNWTNFKYIIPALFLIACFNEFTLVFLDNNPPLSNTATNSIRVFNFFILIMALLFKQIVIPTLLILKSVSQFMINYIFPIFISVVVLDVTLSLMGFGYPSHYNQENIERFPSPYDSFKGKPNAMDHNEFGFRGDFNNNIGIYNVAIYGGSTTYHGNPPIIELIANKLLTQDVNIEVLNFGSVSSNHSQHVHRLIEFSDRYNFDLVIFYGGGNETLQYTLYDPRPGYPYNFFFRNELAAWKQVMLRISSILGSIDLYSGGIISGLRDLRRIHIDSNWKNEIVINYWRDLSLASSISESIVKPKICKTTQFLSVMQPGNPSTELQKDVWNSLLSSQHDFNFSSNWHHADLTSLGSSVQFTDIIHVTQQSRVLIANEMAKKVREILLSDCE